MRSRLSRRAQQPVKPVSVVHTVFCLTLFPYKGRPSLPSLLPLVFSEETIQRLLVTVCGRDTEEGVALRRVSTETVFNGLDVLCWIASIASVDSERQDAIFILILLLDYFFFYTGHFLRLSLFLRLSYWSPYLGTAMSLLGLDCWLTNVLNLSQYCQGMGDIDHLQCTCS